MASGKKLNRIQGETSDSTYKRFAQAETPGQCTRRVGTRAGERRGDSALVIVAQVGVSVEERVLRYHQVVLDRRNTTIVVYYELPGPLNPLDRLGGVGPDQQIDRSPSTRLATDRAADFAFWRA